MAASTDDFVTALRDVLVSFVCLCVFAQAFGSLDVQVRLLEVNLDKAFEV